MENNKYYYLKLKEDFFDSEDIKILESMENGYLYSNILLKMYLKSLKNNGELIFKEFIPYDPKMLATITGHNIDIVEKALRIFKSMNFIDVLDNGTIFMLDVQKYIGKISTEGERKAEYRARIKEAKERLLENGTNMGQCPNIISISNSISNSNYNSISSSNIDNTELIHEIIDYLNLKSNKKYRYSSRNTIKHIKARLEEGYTIDDFKTVIDVKVKDWLNDEKMNEYLCPDTLFGGKFEKYLNKEKIERQATPKLPEYKYYE